MTDRPGAPLPRATPPKLSPAQWIALDAFTRREAWARSWRGGQAVVRHATDVLVVRAHVLASLITMGYVVDTGRAVRGAIVYEATPAGKAEAARRREAQAARFRLTTERNHDNT